MNRADLIVFLGPSLPRKEATSLVRAHFLPPARQGDIWRALTLRPKVIALIDGVFEAQPSVWHRELLDALEAQVTVLGAASMGALRAAELHSAGMVGVGRIYRWARDGVLEDDAEVALLHAGAEHGFRPLSLPLVNVRAAAERAVAARVLTRGRARELVGAAEGLFYQQRHWPEVLRRVDWPARVRARWDRFFEQSKGGGDLKADDARACLLEARKVLRAGRAAPRRRAHGVPPSALVRRRKLEDGASYSTSGRLAPGAQVLEALTARPDARALGDHGLRRLLLSGWARQLGFAATEDERAAQERAWLGSLGVDARDRAAFLSASGLDEAEVRRFTTEAALEAKLLSAAPQLVPDGPSWLEGLAFEARWRGHWASQVERKSSAVK